MTDSSGDAKKGAIGEVVSSSITGLVAESWPDEDADGLLPQARPRFGSFLKTDPGGGEPQVFAIVHNVVTGPQDSAHKPAALGLTREQLKLQQPQIFALLRTEIHAVTVGYSLDGRIRQALPPHPAQVHDFVFPLNAAEVRSLTNNLDFLRLAAGVASVPTDELLAAAVKEAYQARGHDYDFLVAAGQALSHLFREDYDRLLSVLRKINPGGNRGTAVG